MPSSAVSKARRIFSIPLNNSSREAAKEEEQGPIILGVSDKAQKKSISFESAKAEKNASEAPMLIVHVQCHCVSSTDCVEGFVWRPNG